MKVLVVEDSMHAMLAAELIMKRYGIVVDKATDGKVGVNKGTVNHYDLILMDIGLPYLNGIEATHQIKASGSLAKIVGLTANLKAQSKATLIDCGMTIAYEKPLLPFTIGDIANRFNWYIPENECVLLDKLPALDSERELKIRWEVIETVEEARQAGLNELLTAKQILRDNFEANDWSGLADSTIKIQNLALKMGTLRLSLTSCWLHKALTTNKTINSDIANHYYQLFNNSIDLYLDAYNK